MTDNLSRSFTRGSRLQEFNVASGHVIAASAETTSLHEYTLERIAKESYRDILVTRPEDSHGDGALYRLHPKFFPRELNEEESAFLKNVEDFENKANRGKPVSSIRDGAKGEKSCTIALDSPDKTPKEIFAEMSGLDQRYLGDIPGDARSWERYTLEHEGAHCGQSSDLGTLEGEADADRKANENYAQSLRKGENLDPSVPDAWKGARAIGALRDSENIVHATENARNSEGGLSPSEISAAANTGYNVGPFVQNPDMPFSDKNIQDVTTGMVKAKTATDVVLGTAYGNDYIDKNGGSITVGDRRITKDDIAGASQKAAENRIVVGGEIGRERPDLQYGAAKTALDKGFFKQSDAPSRKYAQQALEDYTQATKDYAPMVANDTVAAQVARDYSTSSKALYQPTEPAPAQKKPEETPAPPAPAPAPAAPSF